MAEWFPKFFCLKFALWMQNFVTSSRKSWYWRKWPEKSLVHVAPDPYPLLKRRTDVGRLVVLYAIDFVTFIVLFIEIRNFRPPDWRVSVNMWTLGTGCPHISIPLRPSSGWDSPQTTSSTTSWWWHQRNTCRWIQTFF